MKKSLIVFPLVFFLIVVPSIGQSPEYELSLEVLDEETGLPMDNAQIVIKPCSCGGVTNIFGKFSIDLPKADYTLTISYIGFRDDIRTVTLNKRTLVNIQLQEEKEQLSEVVVRARKILDNVESPQMGALQLQAQELKNIPAAAGEFDILRGMVLLPGVNNAGEISNGLSVRGGSLDQNLIVYDYAPIFNPTHLFGLFSVFTPDVISTVDLYRANIPARYGGRTASVLDVKVKNPYVEKFKLNGGIGLVSSRLSVETPLVEDKLMMIFGARAGLIGLFAPLASERLKNTRSNFYDTTMKLLYLPTENDQISLTTFYSKDFYQLDLITQIDNVNAESNQYDFQTLNGTLNWTHTFTDGSNLRNIFVASNYTPKNIFPEQNSNNEIEFESKINYLSFISEYTKTVNNSWGYYTGIQANRYKVRPGTLDPGSGNSILPITLLSETSYELSPYVNINWNPLKNVSISGGFRFNHFVFVGPYIQAAFDDVNTTLLDTRIFDKGDAVKTYNGLDPRVGVTVKLNESTSIKASYARLNQYLQNIYNTTTPLPTSRWKTADPNIKPQQSDSYGLGIFKNLDGNGIEIGLEGYYRSSKNNLTYKPGADFFLEEFLERDVVQGEGEAYGVEFSLKKTKGKVNGWLNYTWSRSLLRSQNEQFADQINNNQWYPSDFDRPHVFNGTVNIEADEHNTFGFNLTAQTGRPYTIANSVVDLGEIEIPIFLKRNNARLRPYHRLDLSWKISFRKKGHGRWIDDLTVTLYNLYGRKNPLNLYYGQRQLGKDDAALFLDSPLGSYELSVLNSPLFALTYNFKFD
jgi:hypothetical protein